MENETITIELKKDVYARLVQERENEEEPFNSVLRRVLEMDPAVPPREGEPHFYEGTIEIDGICLTGIDHIITPIINHPDYNGSLHDRMKINGIDVRIDLEQPLRITVDADTVKEVMQKMRAVLDKDTMIPEINRNCVQYSIIGLMQVDCTTGERLEKATGHDALAGRA